MGRFTYEKNELCELKRLLNFYNAEKEEYVLLSSNNKHYVEKHTIREEKNASYIIDFLTSNFILALGNLMINNINYDNVGLVLEVFVITPKTNYDEENNKIISWDLVNSDLVAIKPYKFAYSKDNDPWTVMDINLNGFDNNIYYINISKLSNGFKKRNFNFYCSFETIRNNIEEQKRTYDVCILDFSKEKVKTLIKNK